MTPDPARLERLLGLVSDDQAIDWDAEEASAQSHDERRALRSLRLVAQIAELHDTDAWPTLAPGQRVGRFEIVDGIGRGAHGDVYRARDPHLEREVALKIFPEGRWIDPSTGVAVDVPTFLAEARRLASVRHPNVVTIHGVESLTLAPGVDRPALVMEYVAGESVAEWIRARGTLGATEATGVGLELCRALAAVHAAGLVHQDVKAQNVRREAGGRLVLMDFGPGGATPLYMAPELFRGERASIRSDLYAVGVLLFNATTGKYPVHGRDVESLRAAHAAGERSRLRDLRPELSASLVDVIERALSGDPAERFSSAGEMEVALAASLRAARPSGSRRFAPLAAAALCAVVLAIVLSRRATDDSATGLRPPVVDSGDAGGAPGAGLAESRPFTIGARLMRGSGSGVQLSAGAGVAPGDSLSVVFENSDSLYVYVINADEQGEAYLLYPHADVTPRNPLAPGSHHLPGRRGGNRVYWRVTSAGGTERFLLVASRRALPSLDPEGLGLARPERDRAVEYTRVPPEAVAMLRGVGGLVETEDREGRSAREQLFDLATPLPSRSETVSGVWMRKIELENPRR